MPAYVISEVTVLDEALAGSYRTLAERSIAQYDGRYLARGIRPDAIEGDWPDAARIIILEFPSMDRAREWYGSPEYAEALAVRTDALDRRLLFIEA